MSIMCFPQSLLSAIIHNPAEKSYWLFVEVTGSMLTSELADENMTSMKHSIAYTLCEAVGTALL